MEQSIEEQQQPGYRKFICRTCGFIYNESLGDPVAGIAPHTPFEDIPDDWVCSLCGDSKAEFDLMEPTLEGSGGATVSSLHARLDEAIVVVGAGYAGWSTIEAIRESDRKTPIILITKASADWYYKPSLSGFMSGEHDKNSVIMESAVSMANKYDVVLQENTELIGIDRARKKLITDAGLFGYGRLILATGSQSNELKVFKRKVMSVNDLDDMIAFKEKLSNKRRVVIIGGGLIASELADDLNRADLQVHMINQADHLLQSLVPQAIAQGLEESLTGNGVKINNSSSVVEIHETETGSVCTLSSGDKVVADVVLSCIGNSAVSAFAALAGVACGEQGISVDATMRTSDPDIFALGDCVEFEGRTFRFIEPIRSQVKIIAEQLSGAEQTETFTAKNQWVKVKTPTYPIWIKNDAPHGEQLVWELAHKDAQGGMRMVAEDSAGVEHTVLAGTQVRGGTNTVRKIADAA